jgi:hypothetical protein
MCWNVILTAVIRMKFDRHERKCSIEYWHRQGSSFFCPIGGLPPRILMELRFGVGSTSAKFVRNSLTGKASLLVGEEEIVLQSPWHPSTHFSLRACRSWRRNISGRDVVVERLSEGILAGIGPCRYRALVNGKIVAEATGA